MKTLVRLCSLACLLLLAACTTMPASNEAPPVTAHPEAVANYHIGVDDQLQVTVWQNPELSVSVPVRPDGKITVPLIGDVEAGGQTPTQVSNEIQEKLKAYVRDPQVAVIVTQLRSHEYLTRVSVTGAVQHPVSAPYHQGMTVLDAILAAGGVNVYAAADDTVLYRKAGDGTKAYRVRLDKILQSGDLATNYPLQPGDVITVPTRSF
ncbi:MAG: XrtA/PEP-CTERM system exopolysaccharide export protein [Pseudomonadota bacterium]